MKMYAIAELMAGCVRARNFESPRRKIRSVNFSPGQLPRECQGYGSRSSSDVSDAQCTNCRCSLLCVRLFRRGNFEDRFDQMLCFRPRNQDCRGNDEIHPPELLVPRDVLRWHASRPLPESRYIARLLLGSKFPLRMRKQVSPITIESEHEQRLRVQAGRRNAFCAQTGDSIAKS